MQKLTILAILLSTVVISITAEMLSQDYIQTVHPEIEEKVESNVLKLGSFTDYIQQQEVLDTAENAQDLLDPSAKESETPETDNQQGNQTFDTSVTLETLIVALDVPRLNFEFSTPPARVFESFQLQSDAISKTVYGVVQSDSNTIASIREITSDNQQKSLQVYQELKAIAQSVNTFTVNETNEFGDNSFYINPNSETDSAFLVNQKGSIVYAVAYQKAYHDAFKEWFEVLL